MPQLYRLLSLACLFVLCLACSPTLRAQPVSAEGAGVEAVTNGTAAPEPRFNGDVIFVPNGTGGWKPVPLEEAPLASPHEDSSSFPEQAVPEFFVSRFSLSGEIVDDRADLTAEVFVRVLNDTERHIVRLGLEQAYLLEYICDSPGEAVPAPADSEETGLVWLLKGDGVHRLKFTMRVPLKRIPGGQHLQLTLPRLPQHLVADFELRIPGVDVSLRPGENVRLLPAETEAESTVVRGDVAGARFDLRWLEAVNQEDAFALANTDLMLQHYGGKLRLSANQQLYLSATGADVLEMRKPTTFMQYGDQVTITDATGEERTALSSPSDREGWLRVPLTGVMGPRIQLRWQFEAAFNPAGQPVIVDGFDVVGVREQRGTIGLEGFEGYRIARRESEDDPVQRLDTDLLPSSGAFSAGAFQFKSMPLQFIVDIERIPPSFRSTPHYYLLIGEDELTLEARFELALDHGTLDFVGIRWRGAAENLWSVETTGTSGEEIQSPRGAPPEAAAGTEGEDWVARPRQVINGRSVVSVRATRPLDESDRQELIVPLPGVAASRVLPGKLIVATADNVEADVTAVSPALLDAAVSPRTDEEPLPTSMVTQPISRYRISLPTAEPDPQIRISVAVREREIDTSTSVILTGMEANIVAQQMIRYEVQYGRMSRVRLWIPDRLAEQIPPEFATESLSFLLDGQRKLNAHWQNQEISLELPEPLRGSFTIVVDSRAVPHDAATSEEVIVVPILQSLDQTFSETRIVIDDGQATSVDLVDPTWTRLTTIAHGAQWVTASAPEEVSLSIDRSFASVPQQFAIEQSLITIDVNERGRSRVVARYRLPEDLKQVGVQLPDGVTQPRFAWNERDVAAPEFVRLLVSEDAYFLSQPPGVGGGEQWLTITYDSPPQKMSWRLQPTVPLPSFGDHVWIGQTLWKLRLPLSHHLLQSPTELLPGYVWSRHRFFWERTPTAATTQAWETLAGAVPEPDPSASESGNTYKFSSTGAIDQISFDSLSKSMTVLLGAGLTLVAGFLLIKLPMLRNVWAWLAIAFVLCLVGLWAPEPAMLLLQPAICGLLLPVCAALLDRVGHRRRRSILQPSHLERPPRQEDSAIIGRRLAAGPVATTLIHSPLTRDSGVQR